MLNKISKQIECSCCIVVRDSRYVYLQERVSNIHWSSHSLTVIEYSAALQYVSVCALGTFVFSVSGDGETAFGSHDLLKAETKVQAIKSALTNNSAKHNLAKRGSPDECITTYREPINVACNYQSIKPWVKFYFGLSLHIFSMVRHCLLHVSMKLGCLARRPLCNKVNLPSCVAARSLCHTK